MTASWLSILCFQPRDGLLQASLEGKRNDALIFLELGADVNTVDSEVNLLIHVVYMY